MLALPGELLPRIGAYSVFVQTSIGIFTFSIVGKKYFP